MSAAEITTDAAAIDMLTSKVATACAIGLNGRSRRQSFDRGTRAGERNRKRLEWGFAQCLAWYRVDGREAVRKAVEVEESGAWFGEMCAVRSAVSSYLVSMFAGWLLSILAGWLLDLIVEAFLRWILSSESDEYRAAVGAPVVNSVLEGD